MNCELKKIKLKVKERKFPHTMSSKDNPITSPVEHILLRAGFVNADHVKRSIDIECNGGHKDIKALKENVVANAEADCKNGVITKSNQVTKGDDHILTNRQFNNTGTQKLPVGPDDRSPDTTHHLHLNHKMW